MRNSKKNILGLALAVSFVFLSSVSISVLAATAPRGGVDANQSYELLTPIPGIEDSPGSGSVTINEQYLEKYFKTMYRLGIILATGLAVLMIMWGGIEYMTTDAMGGKEEGKERIQSAVMGLLLALGSFIILRTIDPNLVSVKLFIKEVDTSKIRGNITTFDFPELPPMPSSGALPAYGNLPAASASAAAAGAVITGNTLTCYYVLDEKDFVDYPKNDEFVMADGSKIPANANFVRLGQIEGTVRLLNGTVLNYHSGSRQGGNYKWKRSSNWGEGSYRPLTPWKSVAADPAVYAPGSKLFIQELAGMPIPGGGTHDGFFFVDDVGSAITGKKLDVFTGTKTACQQTAGRLSQQAFDVKVIERP